MQPTRLAHRSLMGGFAIRVELRNWVVDSGRVGAYTVEPLP
jgi:hypothetical protein